MDSAKLKLIPNVLISINDEVIFQRLKSFFKTLLNSDSYIIYKLEPNVFKKKSNLWSNNCKLLIYPHQCDQQEKEGEENCDDDPYRDYEPILEYLQKGGEILSIPFTLKEVDDSVDENRAKLIKSRIDEKIKNFETKYSKDLLLKKQIIERENNQSIKNLTKNDSTYVYEKSQGVVYFSKVIKITFHLKNLTLIV